MDEAKKDLLECYECMHGHKYVQFKSVYPDTQTQTHTYWQVWRMVNCCLIKSLEVCDDSISEKTQWGQSNSDRMETENKTFFTSLPFQFLTVLLWMDTWMYGQEQMAKDTYSRIRGAEQRERGRSKWWEDEVCVCGGGDLWRGEGIQYKIVMGSKREMAA